jgi:ketosteroid isomerase-like protein
VEPSRREIVERSYAALARGDMDGFVALLPADAEWHWPHGMADTDVFRGLAEIRRGLDLWAESWADFRMGLLELLERDDAVLAIVRYSAHGRVSRVRLDESLAHLWEFSGEAAVRLRMFGDVEKARRRFLQPS